jgi:hypothetical protein
VVLLVTHGFLLVLLRRAVVVAGRIRRVCLFIIHRPEETPMRYRTIASAAVGALLAAGALAACSEAQQQEIVDDAVEVAVRNAAAAAGTAAFEQQGLEVSDVLACTSNSTGGVETVSVSCSGRSDDGRELAIEGEVDAREQDISVDAIRGSFVGTVDGDEVFSEDCLGDRC